MHLNKETGKYEAEINLKDVDYQGEYRINYLRISDIYSNSIHIDSYNGTYKATNDDYKNQEDVTSIFKDIKFNVVNDKIVIDTDINIDFYL